MAMRKRRRLTVAPPSDKKGSASHSVAAERRHEHRAQRASCIGLCRNPEARELNVEVIVGGTPLFEVPP